MVGDLMGELVHLVNIMRNDGGIDWQHDYKLLNIFIGSNDACLGCTPASGHTYLSPDAYEGAVHDVTRGDDYCDGIRKGGGAFECLCAFLPGTAGPRTRSKMDELTQAYNSRLLSIAASLPASPDFAVVVDPLLSEVALRDWDLRYLSDVDCFHPAVEAHEVMALGVFQNLFKQASEKARTILPGKTPPLLCPTEDDRIATGEREGKDESALLCSTEEDRIARVEPG
ncbi:hypothetical protein HKX48_008494 [Thoreauomyces humboldtii]|nr:hypothetical protein HKX48_008494 [Thoreauomyces humboldtii]